VSALIRESIVLLSFLSKLLRKWGLTLSSAATQALVSTSHDYVQAL
jgi:hypothetical protein